MADRVAQMADALRTSYQIVEEKEQELRKEQENRSKILEKVAKLEQRLLSLQSARNLKCHDCRPVVLKMNAFEERLKILLNERRQQMQELANMKREALEAAISEKDAHLALLEITGIKTAQQDEQQERLKVDRRRLVQQLKEESVLSVSPLIDQDNHEHEDST